jgi:hypothetical protein
MNGKNHNPSKRGSNYQIQNRCIKGKEPMGPEIEFRTCQDCAASDLSRTVCSQESFCSKCKKKGHLGLHCKAQQRPIKRKLEVTLGNMAVNSKSAEASTSKNPQSKEHVDPLPSSSPDTSPSPLRTDLNLAPPPAHSSSPSGTSCCHSSSRSRFPYSAGINGLSTRQPDPFCVVWLPRQPGIMTRAVVHHRHPTHEDYAIVSIHPLPALAMHFAVVQEVVMEFLEEHMHVRVRNIQPLHLGQALVWFENAHDRDSLVINGPFPYGDVQFSFVHHNQGRN